MSKTANPMVQAGKARHQDKMKRRGRAYGLGERNPDTLPGVYTGYNRSETFVENAEASAYWKSLRKKVQAGSRLSRHLP